jgi:hypothetical protein
MSILTDEIKTFIVKGLAQYETPSEVAESVGVHFGVQISRQQVHAYDPACAQPPAQRWKDLHAATRAAFLNDHSQIGIAHQTFRLKILDRMVRRAQAQNNFTLAISVLKQAVKECGGYDRGHKSGDAASLTNSMHSAPENPAAAVLAARATSARSP